MLYIMSSKVDVYLQFLKQGWGPKSDEEVKQYVDNLLEGLSHDIKVRVEDKDLVDDIAKEIERRLVLRF